MSLLSDLLSNKLIALTKEQLSGVTAILSTMFYNRTSLQSIELPDEITRIGNSAFNGCESLVKINIPKNLTSIGIAPFSKCTSLSTIDTESMNPYCVINNIISIEDTAWYSSQPEESMITMAQGRILIGNKITKPSEEFVIPNTVLNLAYGSCATYGDTDSNFISIVVPDTVEMLCNNPFYGSSSLTKITIGASVNKILGFITPSNKVTTLIFRQPEGMNIELPTPGSSNGMGYQKDAYSMNIYTDNEYIKNYDWATDNVTVTLYPLSEAPT